ncbi:uncharacterized protein TNCV_1885251 [Trichonephila clavipes]|nr:uncharacterized protein TNCV_1885251 [Trichonephila clavipes]
MCDETPRDRTDGDIKKRSTCRNWGGGDRGRVAIYRPFGEFRRAKSHCHLMVLKANDRRTSCPCHHEFRGPRSDYVRQVASENNNNNNNRLDNVICERIYGG